MDSLNRYTAEEVSNILKSAGFDITKRTVNYYAFEKKMFEIKRVGKKIFTNLEVDKILAILLLRERSDMNLDEIKKVINSYDLEEIKRKYPKNRSQFRSFVTQDIKETYPLGLYDNHIILLVEDKKVLLGTGGSKSIGQAPLRLLTTEYRLDKEFMGITCEEISQFLGTEIDVMLGGDILKDLHLVVDINASQAIFSPVPFDYKGSLLPVDLVLNIPILEIEWEGKKLRVFLDTGAKVSYLRKKFTDNYPRVGKGKDFYPGLGTFEVDMVEIPVKVGDSFISLKFGNLPEALEVALLMAGCDGIIGFDLFRYFYSLYFNLPGRMIYYKKRAVPLA